MGHGLLHTAADDGGDRPAAATPSTPSTSYVQTDLLNIDKNIDLTVHRQHLCIVGVVAAGGEILARQKDGANQIDLKGFRIFRVQKVSVSLQ